MSGSYAAPAPLPGLPMIDPATGIITEVWFEWFQALLRRTGGTSGATSAVLVELAANTTRPGVAVTLGASPFVFTAPSAGAVLISGGGMVKLEITANGTTWYSTGSWYGAAPLSKGSQARLTYVGAPVVTFIPG